MNTTRRRVIIGVFGSSRPATPETADDIAYQIAAQGCGVLTGGDGSAGNAVRDRAIRGAERARKDGHDAVWVGVARTAQPGRTESTDSHIILRPGYEHKRNYVEAHLCDVAIALPGRQGTPSEVAFCLVLGRPLVLVGPIWETDYMLLGDNSATALERFRQDTMSQMSSGEQKSPLDTAIRHAYRSLTEGLTLPAVRYLPLPDGADVHAIIECALGLVDRTKLPGRIPALPEFKTMVRDYTDWLTQLSPRTDGRIPGGEVTDSTLSSRPSVISKERN